jgi:hypothetical protein
MTARLAVLCYEVAVGFGLAWLAICDHCRDGICFLSVEHPSVCLLLFKMQPVLTNEHVYVLSS